MKMTTAVASIVPLVGQVVFNFLIRGSVTNKSRDTAASTRGFSHPSASCPIFSVDFVSLGFQAVIFQELRLLAPHVICFHSTPSTNSKVSPLLHYSSIFKSLVAVTGKGNDGKVLGFGVHLQQEQ